MSRKDRINIAVAADVAQQLSETADSIGMTQFALANDILSAGLDLVKEGFSAAQIKDLVRFWRVCLDVEAVPVPGKMLDKLISSFYKQHSRELEELWCEAGRTLAAYFKALFAGRGLKDAVELMKYLGKMLPARRFEARLEGEDVVLSVIGVGYTKETVLVNAAAAKCFFESFGYKITQLEVEAGILLLRASPASASAPQAPS